MQELKTYLASNTPATFKDARMTLESVLASSALAASIPLVAAYAVAVSLGARGLALELKKPLTEDQIQQAEVAAASMGMTNVYFSYLQLSDSPELKALPAQLRMVTYGQQEAKDKLGFEAAALAVSVAGKCKPCIAAHVDALKALGVSAEGLRDLGRIAASVNALSKVL